MGIQEVILEELTQKAIKEGLEVGREEGRESEKHDIILKGYAQGLPVALLSKLTDWPEEKVKGIITENVSAQPE